VPQELDRIGSRTGPRDDERDDGLARARVRFADHRDVGDVGVLREHLLDLTRVHVEPGDDDHVLGALDEREPAVVVDYADVAGVQPAVGVEHPLGRVGIAPVAREHIGPAHEDLAGIAREHVVPVGVGQPDVDTGERRADGAGARLRRDRARGHDRRRLGEPVPVVHREAEALLHLVDQLGAKRRRARHAEPDPRERVGWSRARVEGEPRFEDRGYGRHDRHAVGADAVERLARVEVVDQRNRRAGDQ